MTDSNEVTVHRDDEVERAHDRRLAAPATDISETPQEYVVTADLPGVDPDSVDVTFEKNVLRLRGSVREREYEGYTLAYSEFDFTDYERAFELSEQVDVDAIEASFKEGVLRVRLPKRVTSAKRVSVLTD